MELIIKPTEICDFACSFCSSSEISESKKNLLDLDKVFQFLERHPQTESIIVNGGEPLMVEPEYYFKILDYIEEHSLPTGLGFTSNLWDFYKKPDKWEKLFKHPRVGVCTSFNYGGTRKITKSKEYTEEQFWKVSDLFLERIGYRPDFISVINYDNEDTAIDCVKLAKKMGVECKLNPAMASGRQSAPYPLARMYTHYLNVVNNDLAQWEFNTKEIFETLNLRNTICPKSRHCDSTIRCLQPDGDYYSCGSFADDRDYAIDFEKEMNSEQLETPLSDDYSIASMKSDCFSCELFSLCNGCRKTIKDMKTHGLVDNHCHLMQTMKSKLLEVQQYEKPDSTFH